MQNVKGGVEAAVNFGRDDLSGTHFTGAFQVTGLAKTNVNVTPGSNSDSFGNINFDASRVSRTSTETRGANAALYPRILL